MQVSAKAAKNIKIEIVNLTWTIRAGHIASFHAKAILPDGNHAILICHFDESECAGLQSAAPKNKWVRPGAHGRRLYDDRLGLFFSSTRG